MLQVVRRLKAHFTRIHEGDGKKFPCTACGLRVSTKQNLQVHIARKHTNVPQQVSLCSVNQRQIIHDTPCFAINAENNRDQEGNGDGEGGQQEEADPNHRNQVDHQHQNGSVQTLQQGTIINDNYI